MDELGQLLEERAVLRALHRYAHAMDYGDEETWVDCFTPDAVFDVVEIVGERRVHREQGRDELARYVAGYIKLPRYCKHLIVDPLIDVSGDEAKVEAYWVFLRREEGSGKPEVVAFGRYRDRMVKQDGTWRIAERFADVEATTA